MKAAELFEVFLLGVCAGALLGLQYKVRKILEILREGRGRK